MLFFKPAQLILMLVFFMTQKKPFISEWFFFVWITKYDDKIIFKYKHYFISSSIIVALTSIIESGALFVLSGY